jgi:hypothetical protein
MDWSFPNDVLTFEYGERLLDYATKSAELSLLEILISVQRNSHDRSIIHEPVKMARNGGSVPLINDPV